MFSSFAVYCVFPVEVVPALGEGCAAGLSAGCACWLFVLPDDAGAEVLDSLLLGRWLLEVLLLELCGLLDDEDVLLLWPIEVSLDGTAVAPEGIELSYSRLSFSMAERMLELIEISSVSARV